MCEIYLRETSTLAQGFFACMRMMMTTTVVDKHILMG